MTIFAHRLLVKTRVRVRAGVLPLGGATARNESFQLEDEGAMLVLDLGDFMR